MPTEDRSNATAEQLSTYHTVTIPGCRDHGGLHSIKLSLPWVCRVCGGARGEPFDSLSFDGSRRLIVHSWNNPCGHIEKYQDVRIDVGMRS